MHSLKQGNFFTTKKNGYQYLEKKTTTKLIEGFIEGNTQTWKDFPNYRLNHTTSLTSEYKYNGADLSQNVPGYENKDNNDKSQIHEELITKAHDFDTAEIYAFVITNGGQVTYFKKHNGEFNPGNTKPTMVEQSGMHLFLKPNSGIVGSETNTIVTNDPIMDSVTMGDAKNFNILMSWYNAILAEYQKTLTSYYTKREQTATQGSKGPGFKNKIIQWDDDNGKKKYAFVNNVGVYRMLNMDNGAILDKDGNVGDSEKRRKSFCPVNVEPPGGKPDTLNLAGEGKAYNNWEGACYNPGIYGQKTSAGEIFMDHEGVIHTTLDKSGTSKCSEYQSVGIDDNHYTNLLNNPNKNSASSKCEFSISNDSEQEITDLKNKLKNLNNDLKNIAKSETTFNISNDGVAIIGPDGSNLEKIQSSNTNQGLSHSTADKGLLPMLQSIPGKGNEKGYRQLQLALKNEDLVRIPIEAGGSMGEPKEYPGLLKTQNELNLKMKELSSLGNAISSLDSSMISKQEQIRAANLHFLAWGLAGITIGAIGLHSFFKK